VGIPVEADTNRFAQKLFTPLPGRYDRLAELLRWDRTDAGAGPWSTTSSQTTPS